MQKGVYPMLIQHFLGEYKKKSKAWLSIALGLYKCNILKSADRLADKIWTIERHLLGILVAGGLMNQFIKTRPVEPSQDGMAGTTKTVLVPYINLSY